MRSVAVAIAAALALGALAQESPDPPTSAQESPDLGVAATPEEVAEWDISIQPDGEGLPPGSGTGAAGEPVYTLHCFSCHGAGGEGALNDVLVGGHGTLDGPAPRKTVGSFWPYATTVFDYIRRTMPYQQPQSLSRRRGLRAHRLPAFPQRNHRRGRGDGRRNAARSAHAQPRQLHPRLPAHGRRLAWGARALASQHCPHSVLPAAKARCVRSQGLALSRRAARPGARSRSPAIAPAAPAP